MEEFVCYGMVRNIIRKKIEYHSINDVSGNRHVKTCRAGWYGFQQMLPIVWFFNVRKSRSGGHLFVNVHIIELHQVEWASFYVGIFFYWCIRNKSTSMDLETRQYLIIQTSHLDRNREHLSNTDINSIHPCLIGMLVLDGVHRVGDL